MSEHEIRTNICITHSQHVSYCLAAAERRAEEAEQRADREHKLKMDFIKDTVDGMECLPRCDSYCHEEMCPVADPVAAFALLRSQLSSAKEEVERLKDGRYAWMIERRAVIWSESSPPLWWDGHTKFTPDPNGGVRFARKQDAEQIIETHGLAHARATDHVWFHVPPPEPKQSTGEARAR